MSFPYSSVIFISVSSLCKTTRIMFYAYLTRTGIKYSFLKRFNSSRVKYCCFGRLSDASSPPVWLSSAIKGSGMSYRLISRSNSSVGVVKERNVVRKTRMNELPVKLTSTREMWWIVNDLINKLRKRTKKLLAEQKLLRISNVRTKSKNKIGCGKKNLVGF